MQTENTSSNSTYPSRSTQTRQEPVTRMESLNSCSREKGPGKSRSRYGSTSSRGCKAKASVRPKGRSLAGKPQCLNLLSDMVSADCRRGLSHLLDLDDSQQGL